RLLAGAGWDPELLRDDLQAYVAEKLGRPDGVLIIGDTEFLKNGTTSAGVQRQHSGTTGRTENCQIGVFAAYASTKGRALVDRELYLPTSWTNDPGRCRAAKIPTDRAFATKGELARHLVLRALASDLPIAWVTADSAYDQEWGFRRTLEEAGVGYVLAVPKSQQVKSLVGIRRIDQLVGAAPENAWKRLPGGDRTKGPRLYDWASAQLPVNYSFDGNTPTHRRWVLTRRNIKRPDETTYYLAYAPTGTTGAELIRIVGSRWTIEECLQAAKNECGLDEYSVRLYPGWYRHVTLAMLAHAFLAAMSAAGIERVAEDRPSPCRRAGES
ncbi:IS701 family transposase, partial [Streptomyces sp900116325]|uniref:IS701 family transposase n=1 Tax=Streptomyces sp. 900116325 TaxID=3154295 RepID=UPI0033F8626B